MSFLCFFIVMSEDANCTAKCFWVVFRLKVLISFNWKFNFSFKMRSNKFESKFCDLEPEFMAKIENIRSKKNE